MRIALLVLMLAQLGGCKIADLPTPDQFAPDVDATVGDVDTVNDPDVAKQDADGQTTDTPDQLTSDGDTVADVDAATVDADVQVPDTTQDADAQTADVKSDAVSTCVIGVSFLDNCTLK